MNWVKPHQRFGSGVLIALLLALALTYAVFSYLPSDFGQRDDLLAAAMLTVSAVVLRRAYVTHIASQPGARAFAHADLRLGRGGPGRGADDQQRRPQCRDRRLLPRPEREEAGGARRATPAGRPLADRDRARAPGGRDRGRADRAPRRQHAAARVAGLQAAGREGLRPQLALREAPGPDPRRLPERRLADLWRRLQPGHLAHGGQARVRHRLRQRADRRGGAVDAAHGAGHQARQPRPGALPAGARGPGQQAVPGGEVPQHAAGRRERRQAALGHHRRRPRDAPGPHHAGVAHRRAAAALQRAQGRHEPGRPAARAAVSSWGS